MLLKLIKLIALLGNIYCLIWLINSLHDAQFDYEYMLASPFIILFALNVYIIFGIYRKKT